MTLKFLLALLVVAVTGTALYHTLKPLPAGLNFEGPQRPLVAPKFLTDLTYRDQQGNLQLEHQIFDEVFRLIGQAEKLILVDMFLFNDTRPHDRHRALSEELTRALIARKQAVADIRIIVITDPLNTMYGGTRSPYFDALRDAGIPVVETRLERLRDTNPLWSGWWRLCCQWLGNSADGGWLPNALGPDPVPLRSYLALLNFKANHRKTLIVDDGDSYRALVTSANPHDGSSQHSNTALSFGGEAVTDLLATEKAALALSGADSDVIDITIPESATDRQRGDESLQVVTEAAIRDAALEMIRSSGADAALELSIFYLSHRDIVEALVAAHGRGSRIRVLLDPNNEAFGHDKSGIPNRQVAMELTRAGIPVRWCNTHGEQCHSKMLMRRDDAGSWQILMGSANFTRRNLDNLNLETDVWIRGTGPSAVLDGARLAFDRKWQQGPGNQPVLSLPYEDYADESRWRYWRYRVMEATGMSTF